MMKIVRVVFGMAVSAAVAAPFDCPAGESAPRMEYDRCLAELVAADKAADVAWDAVKTADQLVARRAELRAKFLSDVGAFPARTPLNAKVVATIPRDGYRIEKVLFESRPNFHVPALVFVPDAAKFAAPYPAVLVTCGHAVEGKASLGYQRACVMGAKEGFLMMIYDPIDQGERMMSSDGWCCYGHNQLGSKAHALGLSAAHFRIWDGIRCLDYLQSRSDVKGDRLGVMGNSGGGTMTTLIAVADTRVKAASPSCYITSIREVVGSIGPQDAEQCVWGQLRDGINHASLVLMTDAAVRLQFSDKDFFPISGALSTFDVVRRTAERAGCGERYSATIVKGPHGWKESSRRSSLDWMRQWLMDEKPNGKTDADYVALDATYDAKTADCGLSETNACVTADGATMNLPGERSVYDILVDVAIGEGMPRLVFREQAQMRHSFYSSRSAAEENALICLMLGKNLVELRTEEILEKARALSAANGPKPMLVAEDSWVAPAERAYAREPGLFAGFRSLGDGSFRSSARPLSRTGDFDIRAFGAKADGSKCTEAFKAAFVAAEAAGGGRVIVPAGTWFSGAIHLKSNTELHLAEGATVLFSQDPNDYLPAVETSWEGMECWSYSPLVYAYGCTNVAITGSGTLKAFEGEWKKTAWYPWVPQDNGIRDARRQLYDWGAQGVPVAERQIWKKPNAHTRPHLLQLNRCKGIRLEDFKVRNSPFWTIHLYHSEDAVVRGLDVYAHGNNNDGIDIEMTRNVLVENCRFDQGDDGIVIKSGRNQDAWRLACPTENVLVRNCEVVNGHGLLVVGSEISGGVRNVMVEDSKCGNVHRVFYVKTNRRRGGTVENVCMKDCTAKNVSFAAVCVETDVLYEWAKFPTYEEKLTTIRNLQVDNVTCEKVKYPVYLKGDKDLPVEGVRVNWLNVKQAEEESVVENVKGYVFVPKHGANYGAEKIPSYTLEDPLTFADGTKVTSAADWPRRRREILDVFAKEMYGAEPPKPEVVNAELLEEKVSAAGFAVRRRHRLTFRKDKTGPAIEWISWVPRHAAKSCPVILLLNYRGNQEFDADADIPLMAAWSRNKTHVADNRVQPSSRGFGLDQNQDTVLPLQMLLSRGYAVMTACYCEVSPDPDVLESNPAFRQNPFAYTGVFELWGKRDATRTDNITSLGAWAWALSRGLDLAERLPGVDAKRSVATGYSRLAKAALIAAARDERFAVCVPVQTGGGGCPLAKRDFGENTSTENYYFTHWYCTAYAKHAAEPWKTLSFDQHLLLATIAPRALLVCGFDSKWFDTEGEYLAARAASPAWTIHGEKGLPDGTWPGDYDTSAIGPRLGYVRRSEGHGISGYDWTWMLDFADGVLKEAR